MIATRISLIETENDERTKTKFKIEDWPPEEGGRRYKTVSILRAAGTLNEEEVNIFFPIEVWDEFVATIEDNMFADAFEMD